MTYYIVGIISIFITVIVQISISQVVQIASVVPNFLVISLIFFSLGLRPRYKFGMDYLIRLKSFQSRQMQTSLADALTIFRTRGLYLPQEKYFENIFRGIFLGFVAGFSSGINSRLFWADIFSWTLVGFLLGLIAGPINRENPVVKSLLLFSATFLQGLLFFIPLYISPFTPFPPLFFWRLLLCSLYTTLLGIFIFWLTEKKREYGVIQYGG